VRTPLFGTYEEFRTELDAATQIADAAQREAAVDGLWDRLNAAGQVPLAIGDRVAWLYRGPASSVGWRGDFNRWSVAPGSRLGQSDVWIHESSFPSDARTDYKVFLNNRDWVLDPSNPLRMWGGFGPNSELRMPEYDYPEETIHRPGVTRGALSPNVRIATEKLPHDVSYRVYTPAGYQAESLADLPTVYVTDGHEYAADHLGGMAAVLDNLIDEGALRPVIAVFIDPRDPATGQSRRAELYVNNAGFADFIAEDLTAAIDGAYRTDARAESRTILGTSLGGYFSGYLGAERPDAVRNIVMQSPALAGGVIPRWTNDPASLREQNVLMTGGTFGDDANPDAIAAALSGAGFEFSYTKVNDGHSWGAWRAQLDELLVGAVGAPIPEPAGGAMIGVGVVGALLRDARRPGCRTWRGGRGER
ncbi:MAG: alpha/beta hydrolase-fold protein, partial [Planctomycetota bacterium]